ncbi:MAG: hypothetical protein HAW64_02485 [Alphaproteobacteria bacterium]|nr:hypothetical protein [Alphaproteobacteria bacterium]
MDKFPEVHAPSWKNLYLVGSLGYAHFNHDQDDVEAVVPAGRTNLLQSSADDSDFAYRVGLGYRINDVFAAEFAYTDLGSPVKTEVVSASVVPPGNTGDAITPAVDEEYSEIVEISALARLQIPELSNFAPFLRVGGFAYDGKANDGFWVHYGAGIEWYNMRVEYIRYQFEPEAVDTVFLSVALPLSLFAR